MKRILMVALSAFMLISMASCANEAKLTPAPQNTPGQALETAAPEKDAPPAPATPSPSPVPTPELAELAKSESDRLGFMLAVIGDYFQDGGSEVLSEFSAKTRADDGFYSGVLYFYAFNSDMAGDILGKDAVLPGEIGASYVFTPQQMEKAFTSFFGSRYAADINLTFAPYMSDDGYAFGMSDGPIPFFEVHEATVRPDGVVHAMVYVGVDGEGGKYGVGTFDAEFVKDSASMFGYTLEAFTFSGGGS